MAGRRGMLMPADTKSVRQMLWRSMRIMTSFTIAGLMRTIPEGTEVKYENVQKFIRKLVKHKYVAKEGKYKGGRAGSAQTYRLINNIGPIMPVLGIGRDEKRLTNKCENEEKNTHRDTDRQGESGGGL